MHMNNIDFVLYSKITNDVFHSNRQDASDFGHIILGCQRLSYSQFTNFQTEFNRRQVNAVIYALIGEVVLSTNPTIYFDILHCITNIFIYLKDKLATWKGSLLLVNFID